MLDPESLPKRTDIAHSLGQSDPLAHAIIQDLLRTTAGWMLVVTAIVSTVMLLQ